MGHPTKTSRPSPLQNRVTPFGEIVAVTARGTMMGNRGILHDPDTKRLLTRRWQHQAWICCVLEFKGFQHPIMGPSAYTELFFLDEATALAAGHRPCAYCRRAAFNAFKQAWCTAHELDDVLAPQIDRHLHRDRVRRNREQVTFAATLARLPDGTFVEHEGTPCLVWRDRLWAWQPTRYVESLVVRRSRRLRVLTPASIVATLHAGYSASVHESVKS